MSERAQEELKIKILAMVIFALAGVFISSMSTAEMVDRIVAVVNNEPITKSEVDDILRPIYMELKDAQARPEFIEKMEEARISALNQLIEDLLIYQEAEQMGVVVEESEIDEKIKEFKTQFASEEEMNQALEFRGLTLKQLEDSYRKNIAIQKLHSYEVRSRVMVSPQEIQSYYNEHLTEFIEEGYWFLSSITIRKHKEDIEKGTQSEDKLKLVQGLLERIRAGEDFHELARTYSEDAKSAEGGEMGAVKKGQLLPAIEEKIALLSKGDVSDVIETEVGYHIFKLDDEIPGKTKALPDVREEIQNTLYRQKAFQRYHEWIEELKGKAFISLK